MASVASAGASPLSGYDPMQAPDSIPDDESWAYIDLQGTSNPSSVGFFSSPDSGSFRSFGIIGRTGAAGAGPPTCGSSSAHQMAQPSPPAPSPLFLDQDQQFALQNSFAEHHQQVDSFPEQAGSFGGGQQQQQQPQLQSPFLEQQPAVSFGEQAFGVTSPMDQFSPTVTSAGGVDMQTGQFFVSPVSPQFPLEDQSFQDFSAYLNLQLAATVPPPTSRVPHTGLETAACMQAGPSPSSLEIPMSFQSGANVPPWSPTGAGAGGVAVVKPQDETPMFVFDDFLSQEQQMGTSPPIATPPASSPSAMSLSASPRSPLAQVKQEPGQQLQLQLQLQLQQQQQQQQQKAISIVTARNKVRGSGARVEKRKAGGGSESSSSISLSLSTSAGSSSSSGSGSSSPGSFAAAANKFVIMTPTTISAHKGKPNPFECFEHMSRMTQRGRKGPLANATKENALQVRRVGACFCCHARKVKCDAERPCRNCKKLTTQVPQIVCWQFQDFLPILFPDFTRLHFRKEEMARFVADNVESFLVDGAERHCAVELTSACSFRTTLKLKGRFFTPSNPDILHHWGQTLAADGHVDLKYDPSAAIGLLEAGEAGAGGGSQREDLRRVAREYINALIKEPCFPEVVTGWITRSSIPRQVVRIVQRYAMRTGSDIVKRALFIYAIQYVMSHQLTLTPGSIASLLHTRLIPQGQPQLTARLMARQFKQVLDEMGQREMQLLFEAFSKSLKPKSRREWIPCLAAFLVLTLYMEEVEVTNDVFAVSQNEVNGRNKYAAQFVRRDILKINTEVEKMPFQQFAYQFHQIYQTHSTDASAKSFNPLADDSLLEGELDSAGTEMVRELRRLLDDSYGELDWLIMNPFPLGSVQEAHPITRNMSMDYSARLLSKFLLSFLGLHFLLES